MQKWNIPITSVCQVDKLVTTQAYQCKRKKGIHKHSRYLLQSQYKERQVS